MCTSNEICLKCGGFAGFEKSPEGECCGVCGEWICDNCVDYEVSMKEFELSDGTKIAEDVVCKDCAQELGLHNLTPIREY